MKKVEDQVIQKVIFLIIFHEHPERQCDSFVPLIKE